VLSRPSPHPSVSPKAKLHDLTQGERRKLETLRDDAVDARRELEAVTTKAISRVQSRRLSSDEDGSASPVPPADPKTVRDAPFLREPTTVHVAVTEAVLPRGPRRLNSSDQSQSSLAGLANVPQPVSAPVQVPGRDCTVSSGTLMRARAESNTSDGSDRNSFRRRMRSSIRSALIMKQSNAGGGEAEERITGTVV
jgi:hypothetical protein